MLITGISGLLGGNLNFELRDNFSVFGVSKSNRNHEVENQLLADLSSKSDVERIINLIKPDIVIHCAALTSVDFCEINQDLAYRTNVLSTLNIIESIPNTMRFIYISSDALFDGEKGLYKETDVTKTINYYAKTKLESESIVEGKLKNFAIIRTNMIGFNRIKGESLAEWTIKNLDRGVDFKMFNDVFFSPLFVVTLSNYILKIVNSDFVGRINIAASSAISKYDFGVILAKYLNKDSSLIIPIRVEEYNFKAKRPKNMSLDVSLAESLFGKLPSVEQEVEKLVSYYKKRNVF